MCHFCMHTCIQLHMHTATHAYSYTCIQLHMHTATHAYSYTCIQLHMHTATHAYSYTCIQLHMHTATHAYSYTCIQLHMHTATHAYSYTCIQLHMYTATHAYSYTCIQLHMHTATAQTLVYTSMVQTAGWAYTSLQITPLQDLGAEKWGWAFTPGGLGRYYTTAKSPGTHDTLQWHSELGLTQAWPSEFWLMRECRWHPVGLMLANIANAAAAFRPRPAGQKVQGCRLPRYTLLADERTCEPDMKNYRCPSCRHIMYRCRSVIPASYSEFHGTGKLNLLLATTLWQRQHR